MYFSIFVPAIILIALFSCKSVGLLAAKKLAEQKFLDLIRFNRYVKIDDYETA